MRFSSSSSWDVSSTQDTKSKEGKLVTEENWFYSRFFLPQTSATQLYARYYMEHFGRLAAVYLIAVVLRLSGGSDILLFALIGLGITLLAAAAYTEFILRYRPAALVIEGHKITFFTLRSWGWQREEEEPFPLSYTQPSLRGDQLEFTYHDQRVQLKAGNWPEFEQIKQSFLTRKVHT